MLAVLLYQQQTALQQQGDRVLGVLLHHDTFLMIYKTSMSSLAGLGLFSPLER
jgi:hypothetical protein